MSQLSNPLAKIFFVEMMGVPGSYDASVYDQFEDRDNEGAWFKKRYQHVDGVTIETRNVCIGEPLPDPVEADGLVLAGSYNSVHDCTPWQQQVLAWFPDIRNHRIPLLGICGSHQLLAHYFGAEVVQFTDGPYAGTFETALTHDGLSSPIMRGISHLDCFHYANGEHVTNVPTNSKLLASSGKVPVAALNFGEDWYSTQFHPEASAETLGTIWQYSAPDFCDNYHNNDAGDQLVENFFKIVCSLI